MSVSSQDQKITNQDHFLNHLLSQRHENNVVAEEDSTFTAWLQKRQQEAANWVAESRFPHRKDEEWRFTDLSPLLDHPFQGSQAVAVNPESASQFFIPEASSARLVFVNGRFSPELSQLDQLPSGVTLTSLGNLDVHQQSQVTDYLTQQEGGEELFTALNTAGFEDSGIVWVAANTEVETPIQVLFLAVGNDTSQFMQPRLLVVADTSAKVNLIEQYASLSSENAAPYLCNPVSEIWLAGNAEVNHIRLQDEAFNSFHIAKTAVTQAQDSRYAGYPISLGGQISRHDFDVFQTGTQVHTKLHGLTLGNGQQLLDTHSAIAFRHPHSSADQLHKCILDDSARGVFNGKMFVPQAAQQTDAAQLNRNLLLSEKAHVDTKPELNIVADNVKCSHGATVSQLEADELFYLRSRGLDSNAATNLLINAFAAEIIEEITVSSLRDQLFSRLQNRFIH
ncbi:Iron-regulated ABC transporter permease protein SufD [Halothece sp. PCC 7418]|uniref:Fe-S cluster assembly protein SufD n=1 Tax=Halothece sp. (strain PCC 7418) TaxID=65093 RepID=UPI0002A074C2|nr:Fe-S cluster assembly protein SufD [Halothece sp. PCC 7418]AFZ44318.1 Iron-regulated ABC transporter permease protein SufD [Halothece sp. PCC 7418]